MNAYTRPAQDQAIHVWTDEGSQIPPIAEELMTLDGSSGRESSLKGCAPLRGYAMLQFHTLTLAAVSGASSLVIKAHKVGKISW